VRAPGEGSHTAFTLPLFPLRHGLLRRLAEGAPSRSLWGRLKLQADAHLRDDAPIYSQARPDTRYILEPLGEDVHTYEVDFVKVPGTGSGVEKLTTHKAGLPWPMISLPHTAANEHTGQVRLQGLATLFRQIFETPLQLLHYLGHGGVLHLIQR
jgi:hypothetical protein